MKTFRLFVIACAPFVAVGCGGDTIPSPSADMPRPAAKEKTKSSTGVSKGESAFDYSQSTDFGFGPKSRPESQPATPAEPIFQNSPWLHPWSALRGTIGFGEPPKVQVSRGLLEAILRLMTPTPGQFPEDPFALDAEGMTPITRGLRDELTRFTGVDPMEVAREIGRGFDAQRETTGTEPRP